MKTLLVFSISLYFTGSFFFIAASTPPMRSASSLILGPSASSRAFFVTGCHSTGAGAGAFVGAFIYLLPIQICVTVVVVRASADPRAGRIRSVGDILIAVGIQAMREGPMGPEV
jgi:hypothetical protein